MIFITLGTIKYPFKRVSKEINKLTKLMSSEKFLIQSGSTKGIKNRKNARVVDYLSRKDIVSFYKKARIVISHGGEGSIIESLISGSSAPIIIPRSGAHGEHVDNQQEKIADAMEGMGIALVLRSPQMLCELVEKYDSLMAGKYEVNKMLRKNKKMLIKNLSDYCKSIK